MVKLFANSADPAASDLGLHCLSPNNNKLRSCLIWVYTVCICHFVSNLGKDLWPTKAGLNSRVVLISTSRYRGILL